MQGLRGLALAQCFIVIAARRLSYCSRERGSDSFGSEFRAVGIISPGDYDALEGVCRPSTVCFCLGQR